MFLPWCPVSFLSWPACAGAFLVPGLWFSGPAPSGSCLFLFRLVFLSAGRGRHVPAPSGRDVGSSSGAPTQEPVRGADPRTGFYRYPSACVVVVFLFALAFPLCYFIFRVCVSFQTCPLRSCVSWRNFRVFSPGHSLLYVSGRATDVSHTVPIYKNYTLYLDILRLTGRDLSMFLMMNLLERGYSFTANAEKEIVPVVREKPCYVCSDFGTEHKSLAQADKENVYVLPEGYVITVAFRCAKLLFLAQFPST